MSLLMPRDFFLPRTDPLQVPNTNVRWVCCYY